MALTELTALDNAYKALQPLGQEARRRALQWLSDALNAGQTPAETPARPETAETAFETTAPEPVAVVAPRTRSAATPVAATPVAATRRAQATAASPGVRRGRRVKGGASQPSAKQPQGKQSLGKGERPYRRMPDPDAIMKVYRKVGTVSGLAERFDVPRHTVNHWARRLRSQGYDIGRG